MRAPIKYEILHDHVICDKKWFSKGDICYEKIGHDYSLARDDTYVTGIEHISVCKESTGDGTGVTIPLAHLKEIKDAE